MGMFSFIEKALGLRTGATQAARNAESQGQEFLNQQQGFQAELKDIYRPAIKYGDNALNNISQFYSGNQQPMYDQALASPAYKMLVDQGENAIARHAQSSGGWRSGGSMRNMAGNSQNILQGLVNQNLMGNQYLADYGGNSRNAYANAGAGILNQIGSTMGQNAQIGINQAANKRNQLTGIANFGTNIAKGFF